MAKYAKNVVAQAKAWLGKNESDGSYQEILDIYNTYKPHPRGHKMTTKDPWCAAFVSAVAIKLGYTAILPVECSCTKMIALLKKNGTWDEQDHRVPHPGELIFYNWEAAATGDDDTDADHVGIVESVQNGRIFVIEGNYQKAVKRRIIPVNYKYIRGYGVPKYDTAPKKKPEGEYTLTLKLLKPGSKGQAVKALQILLMGKGYSVGNCGADGIFGNDTHSALCRYQKANCLMADGIAGEETMSSLLGVGDPNAA